MRLNEQQSPDILGLCEIFLDGVDNKEINIDGFRIEGRDRLFSKRCGFYNELIRLHINYQYTTPYLLNCIYRPPNSIQEWIDSYESQIGATFINNLIMKI